MNKRNILIVLLIMFVLGIAWGNLKSKSVSENTKPTVKIGISLPLTGFADVFGISSKDIANVVLNEWKNKDTKYNYEFIIEDDQYAPKRISMVAHKFFNLDKVNAIISLFGTSGKIIAQMNNSKENKIPHIGCAWGNDTNEGEFNFNNYVTIEDLSDVMIDKLKKDGIKNVVMISQNASEAHEVANILEPKLKNKNMNLLFKEFINIGDTNYQLTISKIKNAKPDMIIIQIFGNALPIFVRQMKETNTNIPLTGLDIFAIIEEKEGINDNWFVSGEVLDREVIKEIKEKYDIDKNNCTFHTYDSLNILINAFENAKAEEGKIPSSKSVINYMQNIKIWDGIVGERIFKPDGHIISIPRLYIIKNGKIEILEE